ncbi:Predicted enzyme with a TIM-barrel fold [Chlamydia trachomatis]|nr:Predicted enzyme with a TIM-barrel fold [Chlamydia trachomatis]
MSIKERLQALRQELPEGAKLIAVSKYHTNEEVLEAYDAGQRLFGENRVQELLPKEEQLPKDIEWHLIGTLQRNKVKYVVPFVAMIQSIDSLRLLQEVEKQCARLGRETLPVLLQIHISGEETKHGFTEEELQELLQSGVIESLEHVRICGLMGMAALTDDMAIVDGQFAHLQALFQSLKEGAFKESPHFTELSMGMTHDYRLALKHGATYIRVGSGIFS